MKRVSLINCLFLVSILLIFDHCSQSKKVGTAKHSEVPEYYSVEDLKSVDKIDAHIHLRSKDTTLMQQAEAYHFRLLNINVYSFSGTPLEEQQDRAVWFTKKFPGRNFYATAFSLKNFNEEGWSQEAIAYLKSSFARGAVAVKIYKNVGMELRDQNGKLVMIDNPKFDPVLDYLANHHVPVIGHLGEPKNCWLPLEQMTVAGDRKYFSENPQYHMYLHPEFPSYEQQVQARDHMLEKHPDLVFIGAHLGSLEWSVDELAKRLDKFPNMAVDMAARVSHFRYQARRNWKKVYDFFIRYQDRLIYGTDIVADKRKTPAAIKTLTTSVWLDDWKFFTTDEKMHVPQVEGEFQGLKLPRSVVDKIYRKNAERWLPGITKKSVSTI